jgi:hypothetical protein
LAVYFNHFDRRNGAKHVIVVVEYFILVEWVVCGGIMHFLVVDGGKGNYPKYIYIYNLRKIIKHNYHNESIIYKSSR